MTAEQVRARRNVLTLAGAQAFAAAGPPIIVSLGGIIGQTLAPYRALSTLPVSLYTIGIAVGTIPVALLMRRFGRRPVYLAGCILGMAAGLLAAYGVASAFFLLFCLGSFLAGLNGACVQSYRFAAIDAAPAGGKARALSSVMVGGLVASVIGPQTVIWTRDAIPGIPFAASFLAQSVLSLLAFTVLLRLDAPPIRDAHETAPRPVGQILRTPGFALAVAAGLISYAVMSFVMTAAPIAMVGCGHTIGQAALGIQWHVLAMYSPSFVTGRLIDRFGQRRITLCGMGLLAVGAVTALSGTGLANFWGTLVLLGLGWNFGFLGASSMVAGCARPEERAHIQGLNDFLIFGSTAMASLFSGGLVQASGWNAIAWTMLTVSLGAMALLAVTSWRNRRAAAPALLLDPLA
jgi:MFS family permease